VSIAKGEEPEKGNPDTEQESESELIDGEE
jgi:hypothetical protein